MTVNICVLGSGSSGNCTAVWTDTEALLIDCGKLSYRYVMEQLAALAVPVGHIKGMVITHGHADHFDKTAVRIAHDHGIPLYFHRQIYDDIISRTTDTWTACLHHRQLIQFHPPRRFSVGRFEVHPFPISHRAGCVTMSQGFCVVHEGVKIGYLTDCGKVDHRIVKAMRGSHAAVIEANHQVEMVESGFRPWVIKKWILSDDGHLDNTAAANLITRISGPDRALKHVLLAHISEDHNILEDLPMQIAELIHNDAVTLHLTYHHARSAVVQVSHGVPVG